MIVFKKTLKDELVITLIFGMVLAVSIFLVIQEFSIARELDFSYLMKKVPDVLKPIANSFLVLNIFGGYLHIVASVDWIIICGIYVCLLSSGLISKETEAKTLGLLLSHPIPRWRVLLEKYMGLIFYILVVTGFSFLGFYLGTYHGYVKISYPLQSYMVAVSNGFMFFLALSSMGLFFSVLLNEHKKSAVGITIYFLLSYLSFFLGAFSPRWANVRNFTLFRFFNTEQLFMHTKFQWNDIIWLSCITLFFTLLSVFLFNKKDVS